MMHEMIAGRINRIHDDDDDDGAETLILVVLFWVLVDFFCECMLALLFYSLARSFVRSFVRSFDG